MAGRIIRRGRLRTVAKSTKITLPAGPVRTRRAYFDCRFGQLHVRTAFPTTGGFDEQVTLVCLHPDTSSSRWFVRFLPEIADVRSVYAPDLPGLGESDPSLGGGVADAAAAISDLVSDLRLREIDILGVHGGAAVALELARARPELARRLVLVGLPEADRLPGVKQPGLIMRTRMDTAERIARAREALPHAKFVDVTDYADDLFDVAPKTLAKQIGTYLSARS